LVFGPLCSWEDGPSSADFVAQLPLPGGTFNRQASLVTVRRPWLLLVIWLVLRATAQAETPALLADAFRTYLGQQNRWAYTETLFRPDKAGRMLRDQVMRIDPSVTYADQIVPEVIGGAAATPAQTAEWARRNEETARQRHVTAERLGGLLPSPDFQIRIFQHHVQPRFDQAVIVAEDGSSVTFEIPLQLSDGTPFPEYELTARVDRQHRDFLHATFRQTRLIAIKAGKWSDGLIEVDFIRPDPNHATVPAITTSRVTNKPLFGPARVIHSRTERTDFRRVSPYDERFQIKIGPLRVLGF
jgi:hypothetical protein